MRICHIITRLIVGGAQENTILTCEGLRHAGHDVLLLAGPETGPEGSLWPRATAGGYESQTIPSLRRNVNPYRDLLALTELRRLIRDFRPDVVHTHSSKAGIIGRYAAKKADAPRIVHTVHGMSFNRTQLPPIRAMYRRAERAVAGFTDHFVTVADAMTRQMIAAGIAPPEKFTTVYSGIETDLFDPDRYDRSAVRGEWNIPDQAVVVGTIARLSPNKGYEQLINIMPDLVRQNPDLRFVWVGHGQRTERYKALLRQNNCLDCVHFTGLVSPEDVPRLLAGMDLVVHLSRWEGLPRVAAQASLMRLPVVAFDLDGTPEAIEAGRTGELIPHDRPDQLKAALSNLITDPDRRRHFGAAARDKCLDRFDHHRMVKSLEQLYARSG